MLYYDVEVGLPPRINAVRFVLIVPRPTRLSFLYSRFAVLCTIHPAVHCHLRDPRLQILLVLSLLMRSRFFFGSSVCPSVCHPSACVIIAELTIE